MYNTVQSKPNLDYEYEFSHSFLGIVQWLKQNMQGKRNLTLTMGIQFVFWLASKWLIGLTEYLS